MIPQDVWLHLLVGVWFLILGIAIRANPLKLLFFVFLLALSKEFVDVHQKMNYDLMDGLKDILVTILPTLFYWRFDE